MYDFKSLNCFFCRSIVETEKSEKLLITFIVTKAIQLNQLATSNHYKFITTFDATTDTIELLKFSFVNGLQNKGQKQ